MAGIGSFFCNCLACSLINKSIDTPSMKLGTVSFLVTVIAIFSIGVEVEAAADDTPSGLNPISYPLGGNVDAGSPVTITWQVCRLWSPESTLYFELAY